MSDFKRTPKFTPGPWEVASDGQYPVIRKRLRDDHHMNICGPVFGYIYAENEKANQAANTQLIAAVPELLDCSVELAAIVREMCRCLNIPLPEASLARSDAAIAKALGGQS